MEFCAQAPDEKARKARIYKYFINRKEFDEIIAVKRGTILIQYIKANLVFYLNGKKEWLIDIEKWSVDLLVVTPKVVLGVIYTPNFVQELY
jgi:hypothetical protein